MKIAFILNGISLSKRHFYHDFLPLISREFTCEVFETKLPNDAISLAAKAVHKRFDVVFAAGGDGTVHQVLNGLLSEYQTGIRFPVFAILPIGSGNDFARSVGASRHASTIMAALRKFEIQTIDVGEVYFAERADGSGEQQMRYFINAVDTGMGPAVVRKVINSGRAFGSAFAYYQGILSTFATYKPVTLHAKGPGWEWKDKVRTFAVANGRCFGNGLCIAPEASLSDGLLNIFACGSVSVMDFILKSIPLKAGKMIQHPKVHYMQGDWVEFSSEKPMEVEADGEVLGWTPARVKVSAIKIRILKS